MTAPYLPHSFLLCKRQADQNRNLSDKNGTYHLSNRNWTSTAQNTWILQHISTTEMGVQTKTRELEFHLHWVILDWFTINQVYWCYVYCVSWSLRKEHGTVCYISDFVAMAKVKKRDVFYREGILLQIGCRVRKRRDKWQTEHVSTWMKLGHLEWFYISLNREHFTSGMLGPVTPGSIEASGKSWLRTIGSVGPWAQEWDGDSIPRVETTKKRQKPDNFQGGQKTPPKTPRTGHIEMPKASSRDRPWPRLRRVAWQWNSVDFRISQFEICSKHEKKGAYTDQIW